jgi:hypothetical protein
MPPSAVRLAQAQPLALDSARAHDTLGLGASRAHLITERGDGE